jgi:thiamine-phosphate pyrophosphorylase
MDTPLVRMIDACINRATEGLRVVEDFARFLLDDPHLTTLSKDLRHDLTAAMSKIPPADRLAARETRQDVGTALTASDEYRRKDASQVVAANFQRTQQALRSLEEYCKIIDANLARRLETLRYRTYTLERTFGIRTHSAERLSAARLYVLVHTAANPRRLSKSSSRRSWRRASTQFSFAASRHVRCPPEGTSPITSYWAMQGSWFNSVAAPIR